MEVSVLCALEWEVTHNPHGVISLDKYAHGIKNNPRTASPQCHQIYFKWKKYETATKEFKTTSPPNLVILFYFILNYIVSALRLLIDLGF